MKREALLWFALGLLLCSSLGLAAETYLEPASPGQSILLRVMTCNLRHGVDPDGQSNLAEVACFIRDNCLDLVGLQEVDRNWSARSSFRDQAVELAEATGLQLLFFPTLSRGQEAGYGLAVLSRFPIQRQVSGLYRVAREPRGFLAAEVNVAGKPMSFVVTHLGLDVLERARQAEELSAALTSLPGPLVLVGDLNGRPDDPSVAALSLTWRDALAAIGRGSEGTLVTACGATSARVDFLFVTPEFRIENCLVPEVRFSDHRPIVAHLSFYLEGSGPAGG